MDLHLMTAEPTDEERAAVDALLGPPASGWEGATTAPTWSRGGARRHASARAAAPAAAGAARGAGPRGLDQRGRRSTTSAAPDVPPAEAYGVASSTRCSRRAARRGRCARLRRHRVPGRTARRSCARPSSTGRRAPDGDGPWPRSPCLGHVRAGAARSCASAAGRPDAALAAVATRRPRAARRDRDRRVTCRGSRSPRPQCLGTPATARAAAAAPGRRGRSRRSSTTTAPHGGYAALRRAIELGPDGRDPRGHRRRSSSAAAARRSRPA